MLTGGTDAIYRRALAGPHEHYVRIEVWTGDFATMLVDDLPFLSGSIQATLSSQVTRTLSMSVDRSWYPILGTEPMSPYGNQLIVYRGIRLGSDIETYVWVAFTGRIQSANRESGGSVGIIASDRAQDVLDFGFEAPVNSQTGDPVSSEVVRLITDALPDATFGPFDAFYQRVPELAWEDFRGSALDEMAKACGAYWWALADGRFVFRRVPWTVAAPAVVTLTDVDPGGTVLEALPGRSRAMVYNSQTVTGERMDGSAPVYATLRDVNPASQTNFDGPFGRRTQNAYLNTPQDDTGVINAARTRLRASVALSETWSYTCVPDASVELGDVQQLDVDERTGVIQVVNSFSLPLGLGDMSVATRAQVIGGLED